MRITNLVLVLATFSRTAAADGPSVDHAGGLPDAGPAHRFALAVNEPFGWPYAGALGFSGYGSIDQHQVIRLNVASWLHARTAGARVLLRALFEGVDDAGAGVYGRYTTVTASWMYFPRRAYDGFSVELGALVQVQHTFAYDDEAHPDGTSIDARRYAGTALIGWSWLGWDRVFASLQVGASYGHEAGNQVYRSEFGLVVVTLNDRFSVQGEANKQNSVLLN